MTKDSAVRQAVKRLVSCERDSSLAEFRVGRTPIWRLVRNDIIDQCVGAAGVRDRTNHNVPEMRNIIDFARNSIRSILHLVRLRRYRYLVIGFPRRRKTDGKWLDHFSDPLINLLGETQTVCIEKAFIGKHGRPPHTRNMIYYDLLSMLSAVLSQMFFWVAWFHGRRQINALADVISREMRLGRGAIVRMICRKLLAFHIEATFVRGVLTVIRPRIVLLTSRWVHFPIIYASKTLNIPVWELQHGVPSADGYKYATRWDPHIDPDIMLTFGEYWNTFDWGGIDDKHIVPVGYRYLSERREEAVRLVHQENDIVMLVSQPEMSSRLSEMFTEIARANPHVPFLLKLHPQDVSGWHHRYPVASLHNVSVHANGSTDLYSLFDQCIAVVGYNSTVLFESSFFGLKTGVLNLDGLNHCPALDYIGRYNFFEIGEAGHLEKMLNAVTEDQSSVANPFFMKFDEGRFRELVDNVEGVCFV